MNSASASEEQIRISNWLESNIGGQVLSIERESRWRPSWIAKVKAGDDLLSIYIRGDRGHGYSYPLAYEAGVLKVLAANGIPVPHVYGMCDSPVAIVMDHISGERQLTGVEDPDQRRTIMDEYVRILVALHAIDVRKFEEAGLATHADAPDVPINLQKDRARVYREKLKSRPEPFIEFILAWLERNAPNHRKQRSFVTCDAGQFLVDKGRIAALYDFEISHINDPLADLGGLRIRNIFEPLDDLGYVFRRYEQLTDTELDFDAINYHAMILALAANQAVAKVSTQPLKDAITWLVWEVAGARIALSCLADILNVDLAPVATPAIAKAPRSPAAASMVAAVEALDISPSGEYQRTLAVNLARHLHLIEQYGAKLEEQNIDDVASILGRRPESLEQAELELEQFVQAAGPDRDVELLQLFHRRIERQRLLLPVFDTAPAAAGDVSPYLERCHLPRIRDILGAYDAASGDRQ